MFNGGFFMKMIVNLNNWSYQYRNSILQYADRLVYNSYFINQYG